MALDDALNDTLIWPFFDDGIVARRKVAGWIADAGRRRRTTGGRRCRCRALGPRLGDAGFLQAMRAG